MPQLRIHGLVRLARTLQQELTALASEDHRQKLHALAQRGLQQVHRILARQGTTLEQLPVPSRRAYRFLAGTNWLTARIEPTLRPPPKARVGGIQLRGFGAQMEALMGRLSQPDAPAATVEVSHAEIVALHQIAEGIVQKGDIKPEQLTAQSWAARGWLAYLAARENVEAYRQAVTLAVPIFETRAQRAGHPVGRWQLYLCPMRGIYRVRGHRLYLPTPWLGLDAAAFTHLANLVFERQRTGHAARLARQAVHEAMHAATYQAIQAELESLAGMRDEAQGSVHDLGASFARVNRQYFADAMPRPKLTWSRTFTGRVFGYYNSLHDRLMVSRTLDQPEVPEFVVDFIVYHELLHKQQGVRWAGGRRLVHTPDFRHHEKQFERYAEAESVLKQVAGRSRRP